MPFFSILIPTRNRANLLVNSALKSVLNQDFEDFEVVICDNASNDNTRELVEKIKNKRVRYVYSPKWIPKEKFFEFSLKQAKGEFSLLFFDDDVLISSALRKCYEILKKFDTNILTFPNSVIYYYPDWHETEKRNLLILPPYGEEVYVKISKIQLEKIFDRRCLLPSIPDVTNSFYKTSFILKLINRYGTLFPFGHMGDFTIACYTLSNTDYYLYFDHPVIIFGHWSQNTAQQLRRSKTTMSEYQEWIGWATKTLLSDMPFKSYLWNNCSIATLLKMKKILNLPWEIDWVGYFRDLRAEIRGLKKIGIHISQLEKEFYSVLSKQPKDIQKAIQKEESPKNLTGRVALQFKGETYNFNNILLAKDFFEDLQKNESRVLANQQEVSHKLFCLVRVIGKGIKKIFGPKVYNFILRNAKLLAKSIIEAGE